MKKQIGRRLVSLLLTVVTILTMLPAMTLPALAATKGKVTGLTGADIELIFNGEESILNGQHAADNPWTVTDGVQINGHVEGKTNWAKIQSSYNSTLTITNKKDTKATLSFDYTIETSNEGTIKVNGKDYNEVNNPFSKELGPEESITVSIDSGKGEGQYADITMSNVKLVADATATVTFRPAVNGSYTVDGIDITEQPYTKTQSSMTAYQLVATPAEGYVFRDWYNVTTGKTISKGKKCALNVEEDCTITARFLSQDSALFEVGDGTFVDLGEAVDYATQNKKDKITLIKSGSLSAGDYTIPTGVTLLIPFDNNRTDYTTMPGTTGMVAAKQNQSVYTTLTMDEGSQITVYGNISLPAQVSSANAGYTGVISGPCGTIHMKPSSSIVLKDGSNLYCWGFITGTGDIKAESGATVYEEFQICDYRGGFETLKLNTDKNVFPFTQYYIQNIEATLEIKYGAKEIAVCRLHSSQITKADVSLNFITQDSGGLFNLQSGSSFVKKYDSATERVTYEVIGDAKLSSIKIDAGATVQSKNFNLPIMQNTTINVKRGTTTLDQSLCLIPGSQVIVDEGATVNIASGKSLFVYDRSDWVYKEWDTETIDVNDGQKKPKYINSGFTFPGSTDFKPEFYTPSRSSDSWKSHFTTADMKDVKFDVNGTLNVAGNLYTTKGGADITSSLGSGKVVLTTAPTGDVTTHQYMQSRKEYKSSSGKYETEAPGYKDISATPAKLHNADGSYTETNDAKAGDTFTYCKCQDCGDGTWVKDVAAIINNGTQGDTYSTLKAAVKAYSPDNTTAPTNYIKLLHNTTEDINNITKDIYLDLNGRTVTGDISVTGANKLSGMDSSTGTGYDTAPSGKIVGKVTGTVAPVFEKPLTGDAEYNYLRYVAIKNEEGTEYTFHRFNISVTGYRFELATGDTPQCALFFIGKFQGDAEAKKHLTSLGITLTGDNGPQLGTYSYSIPKDKAIPKESDPGESPVVRDADDDAFLFEAYLMRDINKENYQTKFTATARATFDNDGKQDSKPQQLSFKDAWTDPKMVITPEQKTILENFKAGLGITNQTE